MGLFPITHVLIWLVTASPRLEPSARIAIEACPTYDTVWGSAISLWEIGMLTSRGHIVMPDDSET
jgi:hypothetical protein